MPLLVRTCLSAVVILVIGQILRADDPPAPSPPPGSKVVYINAGGRKIPIFVKQQTNPMQHANMGEDPLDHQKVFSETNPMSNKTFMSPDGSPWNKPSSIESQDAFVTKVYNTPASSSVYNIGTKSTFRTSAYSGATGASGYDKSFATKTADTAAHDDAAAAFAAIGSSDQNRTAPIDARAYETFDSSEQNKTYTGPEAEAIHRRAKPGKPIDGDLDVIGQIPNRPLSIDEVKNLINHGFKPDFSQPAAPASRPLNDPDFQPEPLRIEPTESEAPPVSPRRALDEDKDDPVPPPGTMAEPPPENSQPLPAK